MIVMVAYRSSSLYAYGTPYWATKTLVTINMNFRDHSENDTNRSFYYSLLTTIVKKLLRTSLFFGKFLQKYPMKQNMFITINIGKLP